MTVFLYSFNTSVALLTSLGVYQNNPPKYRIPKTICLFQHKVLDLNHNRLYSNNLLTLSGYSISSAGRSQSFREF
jgi:hypothetical protein